MPLFEFLCQSCDKEFEVLVRAAETPECPACHGRELQRRLSTFAAHTPGGGSAQPTPTFGGCGSCGDPRGPGACSMN
jgi:putative FmdB family regulatory protein